MAYQNINQYNYPKLKLQIIYDGQDMSLSSDEVDYNQEVVFSPFLILAFLIGLAKLGLLGEMPDPRKIEDPSQNKASVIYTSDGKILGKYFIENRVLIDYEDISPNVINALIPTEDVRFYDHSGIDPRGTLRAFARMGKDGGASTISQQLAKLLFHDKPRNKFQRLIQKIKEWVICVDLERSYTKKEILTMDLINDYNNPNCAESYYEV